MNINRLKILIFKEILVTLGNPKIRMMLIFPIIMQMVVFSNVAKMDIENISIGIINNDHGKCTKKIIDDLTGAGKFFKEIKVLKNKKEAINLIDNGKISGYINIPNDFSRNAISERKSEIGIFMNGKRLSSAIIISGYVSSILQKSFNVCNQNGIKFINAVVPSINIRYWFNQNLEFIFFMGPSLLVSIIGMGTLNTAALSIAREKELGTFDQLLISPATPDEIVAGKAITSIIICLLQGFVSFCIITLFLGVPFRGSFLFLLISMIMIMLSMTSLGLFVSSISKNQQQAVLFSFCFSIPCMNTSGFSTMFENMPIILQEISYLFNPLYHGLSLARSIFLKDSSIFELWPHVLQLAIISSLMLFIAIRTFRRRVG